MGVRAERDPRRNGMDGPFGSGLEPLHPQLALLTGASQIAALGSEPRLLTY